MSRDMKFMEVIVKDIVMKWASTKDIQDGYLGWYVSKMFENIVSCP